MARRTKKQKRQAKYRFLEAYLKLNQPGKSGSVKGQNKKSQRAKHKAAGEPEKALNQGNQADLASIKKDLVRSLGLASLILSLILVVYLSLRNL